MSNATNLTANVVWINFHIYYCRDVQAKTYNSLMTVDTNGVGSADPLAAVPVVSSNGWDVAFACRGGGLLNGDQNGFFNVYLRDQNSQTTELISPLDASLILRTGNGSSFLSTSAMSDDGRKLVFTSLWDDLVPNDSNSNRDVFVYDTQAGTNTLVSVGMDGNSAATLCVQPGDVCQWTVCAVHQHSHTTWWPITPTARQTFTFAIWKREPPLLSMWTRMVLCWAPMALPRPPSARTAAMWRFSAKQIRHKPIPALTGETLSLDKLFE